LHNDKANSWIADLTKRAEKICRLRPVAEAPGVWAPGKKTAAAIHQEIRREVSALLGLIFAERRKTSSLDLEAIEMAIRGRCVGPDRPA
jgi:hypothetical protein